MKKPCIQENNMILQVIPQVYQFQYESNKQDIIIFKRDTLSVSNIQV